MEMAKVAVEKSGAHAAPKARSCFVLQAGIEAVGDDEKARCRAPVQSPGAAAWPTKGGVQQFGGVK